MSTSQSQFAHPRGPLGWLAGMVMACQGRRRNQFAISVLDPQPGEHLLEIGFGPGVTIKRLAKLVGRGSVAGIDNSRLMVGQARRRNAADIAAGRVDLRYGSVELIPFPDGDFDRVLSTNSQHHWPSPITNLREVRRVLKPGGEIVIAEQPVWETAGTDDCKFAEELAARLTAAGFTEVAVSTRRMRLAPTICVRGVNPRAMPSATTTPP